MKRSGKKIFNQIIAMLISVMIVVSMAPLSLATGEMDPEPKEIETTYTVSENMNITEDMDIPADAVWKIDKGITVTVSAKLTVQGVVIVDGTSKIVTVTGHDDEKNKDFDGSICFDDGSIYIKGEKCILGSDETYKYESAEISPLVLAGEGTVITVKTNGETTGSAISVASDTKDNTPSLKINGAFRIGKDDKITIAENTEISAPENSITAVAGAAIYNKSTKCADILNKIENASVYHWVEVNDAEDANKSEFVEYKADPKSTYTVNAPEGKYISKLTVDGTDDLSAVKNKSKEIIVEKPVSITVAFENIPDATLSINSPKYVVKGSPFSAIINTNRDGNIIVDGTELTVNENVSRKETETGFEWTVKNLTVSETKEYSVVVPDSHFSENASGSFTVIAVDPISVSASAKDGEKEYDGEYFTANDVVFTIETKGGIPQSDGTAKTDIAYSKDGGNTYTNIIGNTFTATESGEYIFKATDAESNSATTAAYTVKIDKINPSLDVKLSSDDWAPEVVVTVIPTVGDSGIKRVYYTKNGVENEIAPDENEEYIYKINSDTSDSQEYSFFVENMAGVVSEAITKTIKVDKIAPAVSVSVKRENPVDSFIDIITGSLIKVNSEKYIVTVIAEDKSSGMKETEELNADDFKCVILPDGETDLSKGITVTFDNIVNKINREKNRIRAEFNFSDLENGKYNIYTQAVDKAGNAYEGKLSFEIDGEKKIISFDVNNDNNTWSFTVKTGEITIDENANDGIYYVNKDFVLNAKATNMTKINSVVVSHNDKEIGKFTVLNYDSETGFIFDNNIFKEINDPDEMCPDGTYKFVFDTDGDAENTVLTVVKDSGTPNFDLSVSEKIVTDAELIVKNIENISSGLESIKLYKIENDETETEIVPQDGKDSVFEKTEETENTYKAIVSENGKYRVKVFGKSGMVCTKDIEINTIYKKAPVQTVSGKILDEKGGIVGDIESDTWTNQSVELILSVNEDNRGKVRYQYSVNGGEYTDLRSTVVGPFNSNTDQNLTIKAIGENGLESKEEEFTVKVDKTEPSVAIEYSSSIVDKIINIIGKWIYSQDTVKVKVTANDEIEGLVNSGIKKISLYQVEGESRTLLKDKNDEDCVKEFIDGNLKETVSFAINKSTADIIAVVEDVAGNTNEKSNNEKIVIDSNKPIISFVENEGPTKETAGIKYFQKHPTITVKVTDDNFDEKATSVSITDFDGNSVKGYSVDRYFANDESNIYSKQIVINEDGNYKITVKSVDKAGNESDEATYLLSADETAPEIEITFDKTAKFTSEKTTTKYFSEKTVVATVKITELNFVPEESIITVAAIDSDENNYTISEWTHDETEANVYVATVKFVGEDNYLLNVTSTDYLNNDPTTVEERLTVDRTAPEIEITYGTNPIKAFLNNVTLGLFFKDQVDVTVSVKDAVAGVSEIEFSGELEDNNSVNTAITTSKVNFDEYDNNTEVSKTFSVAPQYRGTISAVAADFATNVTKSTNDDLVKNAGELPEKDYSKIELVVDNIAPVISDIMLTSDGNMNKKAGVGTELFVNDNVKASFTITEANFFSEDVAVVVTNEDENGKISTVVYQNGKITVDGKVLQSGEKDPYGYNWNDKEAFLSFENDGDYSITVNYTDKTGNVAEEKATKFTVDKTAPVIEEISFDKTAKYTSDNTAINYFSEESVVMTVKVKEHNFDAVSSIITVTPEEKTGRNYTISEWTQDKTDNNVYIATVTLTEEDNYSIGVNVKDYALREASAEKKVTLDRTAPLIEIKYNVNPLKAFLNEVTLGLFFNETVTAKVTFDDKIAGLRNIKVFSTLEEGVSSVNKAPAEISEKLDEKTTEKSIDYSIEPQFRGTLVAEASDYSTNSHRTDYKDLTEITAADKFGNVELVVDNKAPVISDIVLTSVGNIQVKSGVGTEQFANDNVTASFTVTEANFFSEDVVVTVKSEDENGKLVTVTYQKGEITVDGVKQENDPYNYSWSKAKDEDVYEAKLNFTDENDYTITVDYTDKSGNQAETKTEDFTIDRTAPVIEEITFDKTEKRIGKDTGIYYFSEPQVVATLRIKEHNFDAENTIITVTPEEKDGKNYIISEWNKDKADGNIYVATITFTGENNYSINVQSKDYAENNATEVGKKLTVDRTGPQIEITYSANPIKAFFNDVTLGLFFKETIEVTVSAKDPISGVSQIDFSGELEIKNSIDNAIDDSSVTFEEKRTDVSSTFTIDPQYRGTIKAVATDYATNATGTTNYDLVKNIGELPDGKYDNVEVIVDSIAPEISVEYSSKPVYTSAETAIDYYNTEVTATVTINEHNFNAADSFIRVTAKDVSEDELTDADLYEISEWKTSTENADLHIATVKFAKDANFTIDVTSKDYSGNEAIAYSNKVTVDTTVPILEVSDITFSKNDIETTANNINYESYQYFYNGEITVTIDASDATSGVKAITFYAVDYTQNSDGEIKTIEPSRASQTEKNGYMTYSFKLPANFKGNIYAQAEDYSTNKSAGGAKDGYTESQGLVIENNEMHESIALDTESSIIPGRPANENGFYNADLPVKLCISDVYSGINNITYTVGSADPISVDLTEEKDVTYEWSVDVVLNSVSNNNNNVPVILSYVDNAGNPHETRTSFNVEYKIDITAPVIDISYDNNSVQNGKYFKSARTMTVKITELNFKASDVVFKMTKDGQPYKSLVPSVDKWKTVGTEHWVTITFAQDGDYTFDISYTDLAGNKNKNVNYGNSVVPKDFTIDNVNPVISVAYDNQLAKNGNYYNKGRVATVTVFEHNFNPAASIVSVTAQIRKNGSAVAVPTVSSWRNAGNDSYIATVNFSDDAFYTLDVAVTDLSGRVSQKFNKEEFTVDKTNPVVKISGVSNKSANKMKEIRPIVSVNDTNVNGSDVTIIMHGAKNGTVFLYENGSIKKHVDGYGDIKVSDSDFRFVFDNIQKDDIYTLSVTSTDLAGNQNKFISALNGNGSFMDLSSNAMMFSVNRIGSTYMLSNSTQKVVKDYYVNSAPEIVVTEINADKISNYEITVGSSGSIKTLKEGTDYSVEKHNPGERNYSGGDAIWYENTYKIFSSYFKNDQRYDINLSSNDRATNDNSTIGRCQISFCLDTHKPTVAINADGLNSHNSINAEKAMIRINVNDNNCDIEKCIITLDNRQLKIVNENGTFVVYDGSVKIGEYDSLKNCFVLTVTNTDESLQSSKHEIKFIAVDKAGHKTELDPFNFTLSTNFWILFYSNTPVFIGSIVGVVVIIAAIVVIIVVKRKKSDNEQEQF